MFMGGGFQGMQIFDILIMAVIAFVIFRFIAARRRKQQEHLAPAGAPMQREVFEPSQPWVRSSAARLPLQPVR
jgi:predicted lipid-binding transport protein (Tim44 family)